MSPILEAVLAALALTGLAGVLRAVTASGAVAGALLAVVFMLRSGWPALGGFFLLVTGGTLVTRWGQSRRVPKGSDGGDRGLRSAWHALANAGPAAVLLLGGEGPAFQVACLGALGAALSDTISSEVGLLARRPPRLLLLGAETAPGVDGAMSWLGTGAGILGALLAGGAAAASLENGEVLLPVAAGAALGNLGDSLLGATLQRRLPSVAANHAVNALAGLLGGGAAALFWGGRT